MQLTEKLFFKNDAYNVKYRSADKLTLILLFPFFDIKDASVYGSFALYKIILCGNDIFYRMLNDSSMDWRSICYRLYIRLLKTTAVNSVPKETKVDSCLIIDDADLHKTGRHIEFLDRIFSHVTRTSILDFKGLVMAYHDGKSLFALDAALHCEKGKNKKNRMVNSHAS